MKCTMGMGMKEENPLLSLPICQNLKISFNHVSISPAI